MEAGGHFGVEAIGADADVDGGVVADFLFDSGFDLVADADELLFSALWAEVGEIQDAFVDAFHFGFWGVALHDGEEVFVDVVVFGWVGFEHDEVWTDAEGFAAPAADFDAAGFGFVGGGDDAAFFADAIGDADRFAAEGRAGLLFGGGEGAV